VERRTEELRRRIELYRRYLREGTEAQLAHHYLEQIKRDRQELTEIEARDQPKPP
jgi:hypothetical protein